MVANHNNCRLLCHLLVILKVIFANSVDPDQGPHCLPVCKNRYEKFARIFSADNINGQHFQMQVFLAV